MRFSRVLAVAAGVIGLLGCAPQSRPPQIAFGGAELSRPALSRLNGGTLIVVIPTADGAVVAADSRTTSSDGSFRDDTQKIVAATDLPVVAFATGTTSADLSVDPSTGKMQMDYDVFAVLRRELAALKHPPDVWDFRRILAACGEDMARSRAAAQGQMRGRGVQIGMVAYDAASSTVSLYLGHLEMAGPGQLGVDPAPVVVSTADSPTRLRFFGDTDYTRDEVLQGPGRALLSKDTVRLLETTATVRQLKAPAALSAATDIIHAVSRRATVAPIPRGGVGGPVRAVLLDGSGVHALDSKTP